MKSEPDIKIKGFSLWALAREFPEAKDFWTANWLIVSAELHTGRGWSRVENSACLMSSDLANFLDSCFKQDWQQPCWEIRCENWESEVQWIVKREDHPYRSQPNLLLSFRVNANPSHELHWGHFSIGFDDLKIFLSQIERLLGKFPVIGLLKE